MPGSPSQQGGLRKGEGRHDQNGSLLRITPRRGLRRAVARVEAGADGTDTRFIVTSLPTRNPRVLYEELYCRRGAAENHIKAWKTHLAADRTSCPKASANQFRLFLHAGAYWLLWSLRSLMPKRSLWRVAQFDTLRLRLIKIAARVIELKTMIRLHLRPPAPVRPSCEPFSGGSRVWSHDRRGAHAPDPSPSRSTRKPH